MDNKSVHTQYMKRTGTFMPALLVLILFSSFTVLPFDILDDISTYVKTGNSKQLAKSLSPSVEMTILTEDNVYSKIQAEIILKDFFQKHPPVSVKLVHKLTSNPNYRFMVLLLHTDNGDFRTSVSLKNNNGEFLITEIRIEPNKD